MIPEGEGLSFMFHAFVEPTLDADTPSAWDKVKDQVKTVVNIAVANQELNNLRAGLSGIQQSINVYKSLDKTTQEALSKIVAIQTTIETASCEYVQEATNTLTKNGPLLLLPQIASVHLAVQFEVLKDYMNVGNEANNQSNYATLLGLISHYQQLATSLSKSAVTWRMAKVNSSLASGDDRNASVGGEYYYAKDSLNTDFGLKQYSCYQTLTSGSQSGFANLTYACWPVCIERPVPTINPNYLSCLEKTPSDPTCMTVKPSDVEVEASTCLTSYRVQLNTEITAFWAAHLGDFSAQWGKLVAPAAALFKGGAPTVPPTSYTDICGGQ